MSDHTLQGIRRNLKLIVQLHGRVGVVFGDLRRFALSLDTRFDLLGLLRVGGVAASFEER